MWGVALGPQSRSYLIPCDAPMHLFALSRTIVHQPCRRSIGQGRGRRPEPLGDGPPRSCGRRGGTARGLVARENGGGLEDDNERLGAGRVIVVGRLRSGCNEQRGGSEVIYVINYRDCN